VPFRFRIALLALVTSGLVLVGVGASFVALSHRLGLERVDREIRAIAEGQLHGWHPPEHWASFDRSLAFVYGTGQESRPAVQVTDANGVPLFTSADIPSEIARLPLPALPFLEPPPGEPSAEDSRFIARLDRDGDGRVSRSEFDGPPDRFPAFDRNGDGYIEGSEARQAGRGVPPPLGPPGLGPPGPAVRQRVSQFRTVATSQGDWRVGILGNDVVTLVVGINLADFSRETMRLRTAFFVSTVLALCLLAAGGWFLASRALRPVAEITRMAESLTVSHLDRRIPDVTADAELKRLVDVLNGMLGRLQASFQQAERFSSDAAHELLTPLTVLQGELDNAIQGAAHESDQQRTYVSLLEEVRRLKGVVHKLLLLARADAGRLALKPQRTDLSAAIASAVEDLQTMAPEVQVEQRIQAGVTVMADPDLLGQVILNMTSNAAKYTPAGGCVTFELSAAGRTVRFTLTNTGEPIPHDARERIFDRFYRVDAARSRAAGGAGLGLGLARELARAHGGDLVIEPASRGQNAFTLTLPLA
jgi:heavy metal sensor kinase